VGFGLAWLGPLPSVFLLGVLFLPAMDSLHLFSPKKRKKQRKNVNMDANEHSILKTSKLF